MSEVTQAGATTTEQYRSSQQEQERQKDVLSLVESGQRALDVGPREGYYSRLLAERYHSVTTIDLDQQKFRYERVENVQGDAVRLPFRDAQFDLVFCAEVLEHIPQVEQAAREIARVTAKLAVIGVPYRQDTRLGRTTCASCGRQSPPWGHVNTFDENRLQKLFSTMRVRKTSYVGTSRAQTNPLATFLMDLGRNPWGVYSQDEPCVHCGAKLAEPKDRSFLEKVCSKAAATINNAQLTVTTPHANWIHIVFEAN